MKNLASVSRGCPGPVETPALSASAFIVIPRLFRLARIANPNSIKLSVISKPPQKTQILE
jgi:hypothetical protein